jgi:hypothetical protein
MNMMSNKTESLESELKQAGANADEAKVLAALALSLHDLKGTEPRMNLEHQARNPFGNLWHTSSRALTTSLTAVGALCIGLVVAAISQTTIPGNPLYPVKQITESVAVAVQPNYRGVLMMRRAQEVKQLVAQNDSPRLIDATLQSYKSEVAQYKGGNYADYEYCENTLHQAQSMATGAERLAIAETIASVSHQTD